MSVLFNAVKGATAGVGQGASGLGEGLGLVDPSSILAETVLMNKLRN